MIGKNKNSAKQKGERGFSLLEMAIVITMMGMVIAALSQFYAIYLRQSKDDTSYDNIQLIKTAIAEFYTDRGRYPCPTDPALPPSSPNYGVEMCPGRNVDGVAVPNIPVGTCWGQLCRVQSTRAIDTNGDGVDDPQTVLVGAFPIRNMLRDLIADPADTDPTDGVDQIPVDIDFPGTQTLDAWRNKFVYAVTESMTDATSYNNNLGAVTVNDEFGRSLVDPVDSAHYAIVSLGENGRGAYNAAGNLVGDSCDPVTVPAAYDPTYPDVTSQNSIEYENCNADSTFISALKNEAKGDAFNDDMTAFETWAATDLWAPSPINPVHVYNVNVGNVGVGVTDPVQRLDVQGDIQASNALAQRFCNVSTGTGCFDTEAIAGEIASGGGMKCPAGYAMTGIENGTPICDFEVVPSGTSFTGSCPVGPPKQYMVGVRSNGTLICEAL
ncbi:MAG: type II secretion system protein [Alphaproteobacteria bacterium]|nr:type II secretion system protein [Alphaproteobacteria bacterium]